MATLIAETGSEDVHANKGAFKLLKYVVEMLVGTLLVGALLGAVAGFLLTRHHYLEAVARAQAETTSARAESQRLSQTLSEAEGERREALRARDTLKAELASVELALQEESEKLAGERARAEGLSAELKSMKGKASRAEEELGRYQVLQAASFFADLSNQPMCRSVVPPEVALQGTGERACLAGWKITVLAGLILAGILGGYWVLKRDRSPIIYRGRR